MLPEKVYESVLPDRLPDIIYCPARPGWRRRWREQPDPPKKAGNQG
jgi:hypothetical protein